MSVSFAYPAAGIDTAQLHDELRAAGVALVRVERGVLVENPGGTDETHAPTVWVVADDGQAQGPVDAVVAAHVPRTRYDPATRLAEVGALLRESGRAALRARVRRATTVDDLRAALLEHLTEEEDGTP